MARDKNKDELQTNQRDLELRQEEQAYKAEINLPEQESRGTEDKEKENEGT